MNNNIAETSVLAHDQLLLDKKIGKKQVLVLEAIKILQPCSALDVADYLRQPINVITARVSELHHDVKVLRCVDHKMSKFKNKERIYEIGEPDMTILKPTYRQRLLMIVEALDKELTKAEAEGSFDAMGLQKAIAIARPISGVFEEKK